ncbi:hypothetical protein M3661_25575 [Paenibacillus sp. MER 180]|uniref:hypothetical protein n=1 Tax=Paenibacillus sp. MER 180 TaxID=2939570 RepID=UPI00203AC41B|nr:hypothetical protein [Paenibacillus sp. MER 180]MCM3293479.1 hypothetical protein [Paenibacillus sp. MER 180]
MDTLGIWSSGKFFYDCFEDSVVVFTGTDIGYIVFFNLVCEDIIVFKHRKDADGEYISTRFECSFMDGKLTHIERVKQEEKFTYKQYEEKIYTGEVVEVIEFGMPVIMDDSRFGLETRDLESSRIFLTIQKRLQLIPEEYRALL